MNLAKRSLSIDSKPTFWRVFRAAVRQGPTLYFAPLRWFWKVIFNK